MRKRTLKTLWMATLTVFLAISGCFPQNLRAQDNLPNIQLNPFLKLTRETSFKICNKKHQCKKVTTKTVGSSSHFKKTKKDSYVLTALHNVSGSPIPRRMLFAVAISGGYIKDIKVKTYLTDTFLRKHQVLQILRRNHRTDLAVLKLKPINLPTYKIAQAEPRRKEKLYNVSSPLGLFGRSLVGVFEGRYLGKLFLRGGTFFAHTCPTTYGSSGSPVLNSKGEIVGVTSSVMRKFQSVAFGSTLRDIRRIVKGL